MFTLSYTPKPIFIILTDSFALYKLVLFKFLPVSIILASIFALSQAAVYKMAGGDWLIFLLVFLGQIFGFWLLLLFACLVNQVILGSELEFKHAALTSIKRFPVCFVVWTFRLLILISGYLLLFLPGIFLHVLFLFVFLCVLFEHDGIFEAFKHSARLVFNNWWRTFAIFVFLLVSLVVVFVAIHVAIHALVYTIYIYYPKFVDLPQIVWLIDNSLYISYGLMVVVSIPWALSVMVRQYYDLKIRLEEKQKMLQEKGLAG